MPPQTDQVPGSRIFAESHFGSWIQGTPGPGGYQLASEVGRSTISACPPARRQLITEHVSAESSRKLIVLHICVYVFEIFVRNILSNCQCCFVSTNVEQFSFLGDSDEIFFRKLSPGRRINWNHISAYLWEQIREQTRLRAPGFGPSAPSTSCLPRLLNE